MIKTIVLLFKEIIEKKKTISRFFLYFMLINFILIGVVSTAIYFKSANTLETEIIERNQTVLSQLNQSTDILLGNVDKYLTQLSWDQDIVNFIDYYNKHEMSKQIKINESFDTAFKFYDEYINSIEIYYYDTDKVFVPNSGVTDLKDFYDREFIERIKRKEISFSWIPTRTINDTNGSTHNVISILKRVPKEIVDPTAVVIINMDEGYLRKVINKTVRNNDIQIFIVDQDANVISDNNNNINQNVKSEPYMEKVFHQDVGNYICMEDNKKVLVSFVTSNIYGWKYISIVPYRTVVGKNDYIRNFSIFVSLLALLCGVMISLFFTNKIYKPIDIIANLFRNDVKIQQNNDVFDFIKQNVNRLVETNETIENTLKEHMPILKNNYLVSILMGYADDQNTAEEQLSYYDIDLIDNTGHIVFVILMDKFEDSKVNYTEKQINMLMIYLMEILSETVRQNGKGVIVNTKADEIAIIIELPEKADVVNTQEETERWGNLIKGAVISNSKHEFDIGAGNVYNTISEMTLSYHEAVEALQYSIFFPGKKVIAFSDIKGLRAENFEYPFALESDLLAALKKGDTISVVRLNVEIFKAFARHNNVGDKKVLYYYMQLLTATIKCAFELGINTDSIQGQSNLYNRLLECTTGSETQMWFEQIFLEVANLVKQKKTVNSSSIVGQVRAYINENFGKELSLSMLSQQVFFSIPYLSKIFKDEYGITIKQYINEIRIEKAKELLRNPDYKVLDVAERVGYDKVHGFLKLFKEHVGMTPGEYRNYLACNPADSDKLLNSSKIDNTNN